MIGHNSVGCTIICGEGNKPKPDHIYWCGSVLSVDDQNVMPEFTPTIIQVAAGVGSGLSWIMEPRNKNKGFVQPCDMDTRYILEKSIGMLGRFFFTEIPVESFSGKFKFTVDKII